MGQSLTDLRAIAEGYAPEVVEAFGGYNCLTEGANMQAHAIKHSALAKSAKEHMKAAKAAKKVNDSKTVKSEYDAAIKDLKALKVECEKIEDDHILCVFVETFIKTFIPGMVGVLAAPVTGSTGILIGNIFGVVLGYQKTLDYLAATEKGMAPNKAGVDGKYDPSQWWKSGETRGAAMTYFDRLITTCEKGKEYL